MKTKHFPCENQTFSQKQFIKIANVWKQRMELSKFCKAFIEEQQPVINGNGEHSRDFTYVSNAVQANDLALFTKNKDALNEIYNVACNDRISLNEMVKTLQVISGKDIQPIYGSARAGDVLHSEADISKINRYLSYEPDVYFTEGIQKVYDYYKSIKFKY